MATDELEIYKRKGYVQQPDGSYSKADCAIPCPKPEQTIRHESVAEEERKATHTSRIQVSIISRRCRLLDPDNLCGKYFLDCLRYAGLIPNDRAQDIEFKIRQIKVQKKYQEYTQIDFGPDINHTQNETQ
jgi:hypothetical protein